MVSHAAKEASSEGAELVLRDARHILMADTKYPTGKLASEIKIEKSIFEDGGYLVEAQGSGNYTRFYASFVELGAPNIKGKRRGSTEAVPFLRPALQKNKSKILKLFRGKFK